MQSKTRKITQTILHFYFLKHSTSTQEGGGLWSLGRPTESPQASNQLQLCVSMCLSLFVMLRRRHFMVSGEEMNDYRWPFKNPSPPASSSVFCHRLPWCSHHIMLVPVFDLHLLPIIRSLSAQTLFHFAPDLPLWKHSQLSGSLSCCSAASLVQSPPLTHRVLTDLGISTPQQLLSNTATGVSVRATVIRMRA